MLPFLMKTPYMLYEHISHLMSDKVRPFVVHVEQLTLVKTLQTHIIF